MSRSDLALFLFYSCGVLLLGIYLGGVWMADSIQKQMAENDVENDAVFDSKNDTVFDVKNEAGFSLEKHLLDVADSARLFRVAIGTQNRGQE